MSLNDICRLLLAGSAVGLVVAYSPLFDWFKYKVADRDGSNSPSYEVLNCPRCVGSWAWIYLYEIGSCFCAPVNSLYEAFVWVTTGLAGVCMVHFVCAPRMHD